MPRHRTISQKDLDQIKRMINKDYTRAQIAAGMNLSLYQVNTLFQQHDLMCTGRNILSMETYHIMGMKR